MNEKPFTHQEPKNETESEEKDTPVLTVESKDDLKPKVKKKYSTRKKLVIIVSGLIVILTFTAAYFLFLKKDNPTVNNQDTVKEEPVIDNTVKTEQSNIPEELLSNSQNVQGVSIGYIRKIQTTSSGGSWLSAKAYAEESLVYEPAIFYTNNSNIYSLNTATKKSNQLTTNTGSVPLFSSKNQILAYKNNCGINTLSIIDSSDKKILEGENGGFSKESVCYSPISWSPDGKNLAIFGNYTLNSAELGLVSFTDLYIYNLENKSIDKIEPPTSFNTVGSVYWINENEVMAQYVERGQFAATLKEGLFKFQTSSKEYTELQTDKKVDLNTAQVFNEELFVTGIEPRIILSSKADNYDLKDIAGTESIGTYLIRNNESESSQQSIIMLNGDAGIEDSFVFYSIPISGGEKTELYKPKGFAAYTLGWGVNYDEVIYMAALSGKSEIQMYNISTNKNEVLVADLPLVQ